MPARCPSLLKGIRLRRSTTGEVVVVEPARERCGGRCRRLHGVDVRRDAGAAIKAIRVRPATMRPPSLSSRPSSGAVHWRRRHPSHRWRSPAVNAMRVPSRRPGGVNPLRRRDRGVMTMSVLPVSLRMRVAQQHTRLGGTTPLDHTDGVRITPPGRRTGRASRSRGLRHLCDGCRRRQCTAPELGRDDQRRWPAWSPDGTRNCLL